jgi:hypothetical protein
MLLLLILTSTRNARAQDAPKLPAVTVGAGMRTSFDHFEPDSPALKGADDFLLDSVRLYINGSATEKIKFMFNTEYDGSGNHVDVLDAAARLEFAPEFNIWAGRFLPPSDRANLYGPYYANHWAVYTDGVQDGYPFIFQGRDNGVVYWGDFAGGHVKASGGAFDGSSLTGKNTLLVAGRFQVDLLDPESGYYLNGTYYGDKNLLAIGVAGQVQGSNDTAYSVDFLLDLKVPGGGAFSVESEYARYHRLGGYNSNYNLDQGGYGLASFMFPQQVGVGRFEVLGKYAYAQFREGVTKLNADYNQKTTELDLNYVIKQFNARVMFFYLDTRFDAVMTNFKKVGVGLQIQI